MLRPAPNQVFALNTVVATEIGSIAERTVVALAAFRRNGEPAVRAAAPCSVDLPLWSNNGEADHHE